MDVTSTGAFFFLGEVISRLCVGSTRGRSTSRLRDGSPQQRTSSLDALPGTSGSLKEPAPSTPTRRGRDGTPVQRGRDIDNAGTPNSRAARSPSRGRERGEFIPYRDSKLTRILRSSLGGNPVTLLMMTVHPAVQFIEQSMTSLRFASKARCIENYVGRGPEGNATKGSEQQSTIDAQQRIIEGLQHRLRALEQKRSTAPSSVETAQGAGQPSPDVFSNMAKNGLLDNWVVEQFQGLRNELEEKEKQLAMKSRLLSEREQQLGQLRRQLGGRSGEISTESDWAASDSTQSLTTAQSGSPESSWRALNHSPHFPVESRAGQLQNGSNMASPCELQPYTHLPPESLNPGAIQDVSTPLEHSEVLAPSPQCIMGNTAPRYGPPDEGGGLPVVDCPRQHIPRPPPAVPLPWQTRSSPSWFDVAAPNSSNMAMTTPDAANTDNAHAIGNQEAEHTNDVLNRGRVPSTFQQVQSRAEDIVCLRSSQRYVTRQQTPLVGAVPSQKPPTSDTEGAKREPQKELVEKLLYLAVKQINSVKPGPPQAFPEDEKSRVAAGINQGGAPHPRAVPHHHHHRGNRVQWRGSDMATGCPEIAAGSEVLSTRCHEPPELSPHLNPEDLASHWDDLDGWEPDHSGSRMLMDGGAFHALRDELPPPSNPDVEGTPRKVDWDLDSEIEIVDHGHHMPPIPAFSINTRRQNMSLTLPSFLAEYEDLT